jgi:hypothetical protein
MDTELFRAPVEEYIQARHGNSKISNTGEELDNPEPHCHVTDSQLHHVSRIDNGSVWMARSRGMSFKVVSCPELGALCSQSQGISTLLPGPVERAQTRAGPSSPPLSSRSGARTLPTLRNAFLTVVDNGDAIVNSTVRIASQFSTSYIPSRHRTRP